jgi:Ni/Fe-hydrogenase subunit HybB-like protein
MNLIIVATIAISVGVPFFFIFAVRRLAFRLTDGQRSVTTMAFDPLALPTARLRVTSRWQIIRTLLMVLVLGTGTALVLLRFVYGLGSVTNLSDQFPLGLWIGFDVMGGVALAAGAFVIAGLAHIFHVKRFEPLVRPAILTGLLGYLMAVASLMIDLGRPYNVWRPLIHWQHRSALWEVGVCVALYTTVLLFEFLPVILERVNQIEAVTRRLPTAAFSRLLGRFSLVFVILGVILSTMHQSSLGSLWVLVPQKLHPLWYSIRLPILFWISAVAAGFSMTIMESTISSKVFKRGLESDLLVDLGKYASVALWIYLAAKLADLAVRGALPLLFEGSVQSISFWVEVLLGGLLPALLFSFRSLRLKPGVLFWSAVMVVLFGIVLNRLNVSMVGLWSHTGYIYFPSWMEIIITVTIVSLGVLAFGVISEHLPVFPEHAHE